jgi:phage-related baseplate assembly protein
MATLPTRSWTAIVQTVAAGIQGRAAALIDFAIGSPLRAIAESYAGVTLWLQTMALQILAAIRLATSEGADVDSFVADFGLARLGAAPAVGQVTFSRFSAGAQALIKVGVAVQTEGGTQRFLVVADTANTAYNAGLQGYVVPAGVTSITVPVQALTPGQAGNVQAAWVTQIAVSIPYIDTVTNVSAFVSGGDAESDAALKQRFRMFIASLSKATPLAIGYAIISRQLGVRYTLVENYSPSGAWLPGFFYVTADDGSGDPPDSLIAALYAAIDQVRAAAIRFAVLKPDLVQVDVTMTLTLAQGYDLNQVKGAVGRAGVIAARRARPEWRRRARPVPAAGGGARGRRRRRCRRSAGASRGW